MSGTRHPKTERREMPRLDLTRFPAHQMRLLASCSLPLLVAAAACNVRQQPEIRQQGSQQPFDIVIENGKIVDGTGNPWFYGDVAISGDHIARITPPGMLHEASAKEHIDARGLVVAPGVIDIQAQSYPELLSGDSRVVSMITQG